MAGCKAQTVGFVAQWLGWCFSYHGNSTYSIGTLVCDSTQDPETTYRTRELRLEDEKMACLYKDDSVSGCLNY